MRRRRWRPGSKVGGTQQERMCEGKQEYPSESAAGAAMKFYQEEGALRTNDGMTVYRCNFCPGWHFGH